jgi:hypothetical protein
MGWVTAPSHYLEAGARSETSPYLFLCSNNGKRALALLSVFLTVSSAAYTFGEQNIRVAEFSCSEAPSSS